MFDVGAAAKDALEVDPATLYVDPDIKQAVDAVQLVLPRLRFLLELLVGQTTTDVFFVFV